jgi:endogenous inhibitor of DNA gyrase (YacG/DUF329 family)
MATEPCPICQTPVEVGSEFHPFCSKKCRLVDLGRWFGEAYRVPVKKTDEDGDNGKQPDDEDDG